MILVKWGDNQSHLPFPGRRACLGEGLARMELFLFFVSLFQKFKFSTLDGVKLSTEGVTGATRTPYPFKVYAKPRWTIPNKPHSWNLKTYFKERVFPYQNQFQQKKQMWILLCCCEMETMPFSIVLLLFIIIYHILSFDYRLYIKDRPHTKCIVEP